MAAEHADNFMDMAGEVLTPPVDLRKKVRILNNREAAKFDPVKAAETALSRLSGNFDGWMQKETEDLATAFDAIRTEGVNEGNLDTLFQAVHNIKGQAITLGYPLVGQVAASFCRLIEHVPSPEKLPLPLAEQYVEAIRAMVAEDARDTANTIGAALLKKLSDVSEEYLASLEGKASRG